MKIVICLDYNSFTEKLLGIVKNVVDNMKNAEINVIHIIDLSLFYGTSSFDEELIKDLEDNSDKLKALCIQYLGDKIAYIKESGLPALKIGELLDSSPYDMLIVGTHGKKLLGERLIGSLAERLLHNSKKPVLIIPD